MKVKYVGRKPVPVLVGVELKYIEGDVFETDTPEKLPSCFQPVKNETESEGDNKPKSSKKSRKNRGDWS